MANTKEYKIVINGIQESIDAVKSLNTQLDSLEDRIKSLEGKAVGIKASGGGSKTSSTSSLSEEEKLERQIAQLDEKRVAYSQELYQNYLAAKDVLKETVNDQKQLAAAERIQADNYSNTMTGIKQKLADLKSVHFTTDISTDEFKNQTTEINALNEKLKQLEAEYGVYSRNVGNYANGVAEGLQKIGIEVNGSIKEFDNVRQALKALKTEMQTLSTKQDMGIISEEEAERLQGLIPVVKQLESSIADAGKPMDSLMDMMQSFTALAQAEKGLSAFFGFDNTAIEETIKELVALQNAVQGLQTIQKQLQTEEGLGKYFSSASKEIDNFTNKIFGVTATTKTAATSQKELSTATSGVSTAAKAAATAEQTQAVANVAVTTTSKAATIAAKGLGMALKAIGIGLAIGAISILVDGIKSAATAIADLFRVSEKELKNFENSIDVVSESTRELIELTNQAANAGYITKQQAIIEQFHLETKATKETTDEMLKLLSARDRVNRTKFSESNYGQNTSYQVFGTQLVSYQSSTNAAVKEFLNLLDKMSDAEKEAENAINDYANGLPNAEVKIKRVSETVKKLWLDFQNNKDLKKVQKDLENFFPDEAFRNGANNIINSIKSLNSYFINLDTTVQNSKETLRRYLMTDVERQIDDINKEEKEMLKLVGNNLEEEAKVRAKAQQKREEVTKAHYASLQNDSKKHYNEEKKNYEDSQRALNALQLRLMDDGLNKKLMQLDEEKRQTLNKLSQNSQAYLNVEKRYEQLRLKEIQNYLKGLEKSISDSQRRLNNQSLSIDISKIQEEVNEMTDLFEMLDKGGVPNKNKLISSGDLDELLQFSRLTKEELRSLFDEYIDITYHKIPSAGNKEELEQLKNRKKVIEEDYAVELTLAKSYGTEINKTLKDSFNQRYQDERYYFERNIAGAKEYFGKKLALLYKQSEKEKEIADNTAKETYETQYKAQEKQYEEIVKTISELSSKKNRTSEEDEQLQKLQNDLVQTIAQLQQIQANYNNQLEVNEKQHQNKLSEIWKKGFEERSSYTEEYFNRQISNFRDFNSKISNELSKPTKTNALGFINLKKAKIQLKQLEDAARQAYTNILIEKRNLEAQQGNIDRKTYEAEMNEMDDAERAILETFDAIRNAKGSLFSVFMSGVSQIVGQLGSALSSLVGAIGDYTDTMYENRINDLEKYIEEYEKKLDEQKEITQKYADDVNSIEEELSNARGDRRQQLIDQLNAQLAAQRGSLAQEKRMEKEKQRMEQEKEELEKEKFEQQKKVQRAQAMMSGALAVTNALAVQPIWVGIATAAMVAAMTAVQIATINAQKYANGGVIQGKSHSQGGVKVLGGQAEVEGGEFITNKVTTSKNVDLLEYINTKRRKVNLEDLIDFYGSPVRRNVQAVRTKFADGGIIPTLRTDFDMNDRLLTAFEDYSNRQVVVSVVDINDRQAAVDNVKVLAGLTD